MKKITVEYLRLVKEGNTCTRCGGSENIVRKVVDEFLKENRGVEIELKEIPLDEKRIDESNTVKINGKDVREIVGARQNIMTLCTSCCEMVGTTVYCNSFVYKGKIYDSIPEEMLKDALKIVVSERGFK